MKRFPTLGASPLSRPSAYQEGCRPAMVIEPDKPLTFDARRHMSSTKSSVFERLGATFMALWALIVYALLGRAAGQYGQIFEGIPETPVLTQILLTGPLYWAVLAVSITSYVLYWFDVPYSRMTLAACALSTLAMLPLFIVAMYLPIYGIGQEVQQ